MSVQDSCLQRNKKYASMSIFVLAAIVFMSATCPFTADAQTGVSGAVWADMPVTFDIHRGDNISYWLSQSRGRGDARRNFFTRDDVAFLAGLGFDHLRIPMDEEQMWDEEGVMNAEAWGLLQTALDWCAEFNLKAIIDLHIVRAHHFNEAVNPLWDYPEEQDHFVQLWRDISSRLSDRPRDMVAYELMNEPAADDPEDWNNLVKKTLGVLRELEPDRIIFLGSNRHQRVQTFEQLWIPENDKNIVLSYHFYLPMPVTHYKARWNKTGEYTGPVHYPGRVEEKDIQGLPEDLLEVLDTNEYNREVMAALIDMPMNVARAHNLQLHMGEWGCYINAPKEDRLRWYADVISIVEERGIAWTLWDFKGNFGIYNSGELDQDIVDIVLPEPGTR